MYEWSIPSFVCHTKSSACGCVRTYVHRPVTAGRSAKPATPHTTPQDPIRPYIADLVRTPVRSSGSDPAVPGAEQLAS